MIYVGFNLDWLELNQHLTGKDHIDDSGAVENYAEALGLYGYCVDDYAFIGLPLENDQCGSAVFTTLEEINQDLEPIKKRILKTGYRGSLSSPVALSFTEEE